MGGHLVAALAVITGGGVLVWGLHKLGKAMVAIGEAVAAAAVLFVVVWWAVKGLFWLLSQLVIHWRITAVVAVLAAWLWCWGWPSLVVTLGSAAVALTGWHLVDAPSCDRWAGRWVRAWWLRWVVYGPHLPDWLHACGLTVADAGMPVDVTVTLIGHRKTPGARHHAAVRHPRVLAVRSGPSWDEVRVRLVPGQKPEDFDDATRALASARVVARCQVREVSPDVVSIDFQRRNLLVDPVPCLGLAGWAAVAGAVVDLRRVWLGRTEYGQDWTVPLVGPGAHTLVVGATGAGKNSVMWSPLMSAAPAIRDGLVRVSGIDPKGMELAYGRGIFTRYAVTGRDALALLDDLIECMSQRKARYAGKVRSVPITTDDPLELLEFDEIAALTKYTDRSTREKITERVAILNTQGRALGFTVRGYVQEPTKDTVPIRDLFPRRICLRVTAKSHVGMALSDLAYERGAWANRISESEPGTGYIWGEGIRHPLRVRAAWVPDEAVKALETFTTSSRQEPSIAEFPPHPRAISRGEGAAA